MGTIIYLNEGRKLNDLLQEDENTFLTYYSNYARWSEKIRKARRWSEKVTSPRRIKNMRLRSLPLRSDKVDHYLFLNGEDAIFVTRSKWRKVAIRIDALMKSPKNTDNSSCNQKNTGRRFEKRRPKLLPKNCLKRELLLDLFKFVFS